MLQMDDKAIQTEEPKAARPKPTMVDYYARRAAEEARKFHRALTRENFKSFIWTMVWVVPLTLLLWIYAEQEQVETESNVPVAIQVKSSDPNRVVTLLPGENSILCDLRGPHSNMERVRELLNTNNPLTIAVDASVPTGVQEIQTLPRVDANTRFKDLGITVEKASPEYLRVNVDTLVDRANVPIAAPANLPTLQSAIFTPSAVTVHGPSQRLQELENQPGGLRIVADISNLPILQAPGQHDPISVPLVPVDPTGQVTCSTTAVLATLTVRDADVAYVASVPILMTITPTLADGYKVIYDQPINVKLVGPPEAIDQIKNGDVKPVGTFEISDPSDVLNPHPKNVVMLDLPPGVRVAPGESPQVSYSATAR
jgi:hypothetical protein